MTRRKLIIFEDGENQNFDTSYHHHSDESRPKAESIEGGKEGRWPHHEEVANLQSKGAPRIKYPCHMSFLQGKA